MRTRITILVIVLALLTVFAVFRGQQKSHEETATEQPAATTAAETATTAPEAEVAPSPDTDEDIAAPAPPTTQAQAQTPAIEAFTGLKPLPAAKGDSVSIGGNVKDQPFAMQVDLTAWGAGVRRITLRDYRQIVTSDEPYTLLQPLEAAGYRMYAYAARAVTINGQRIDLQQIESADQTKLWGLVSHDEASATYRLSMADESGRVVAEIDRTYRLTPDSYDLQLEQRLHNRSDKPLEIQWEQNVQGDLPQGQTAYLGDRRLFVSGYFAPWDKARVSINTTDAYLGRANLVNDILDGDRSGIWPNPDLRGNPDLVWLASENRYFAVVTHPVVSSDVTRTAEIPSLETEFARIGTVLIPSAAQAPNLKADKRAVLFTLTTNPLRVEPGQSATVDLAAFAGPRKTELFSEAPYSLLHFNELIRYELGCTWCTFQWLAKLLLSFLKGLDFLIRDWGVAIIILVLVVRLLLHPLTKRAQVNMMKMGKQMQSLQPEMEKLKKKYKDDQTRLNQEMMKLYREKGVNPASALGCLPMFLQMPIWVALYAMLYFAIELRHEPAFYGFFQWISGGHWQFLADLSSADHFIKFAGDGVTLNLLFVHPTFSGINLLPILMAVVFFIQQKYTTPPPANEQAAQQQKMMRFMTLLFPVFLYSAPSGLTLYILASTTAGIVDSYIVRKHVKEQEEAGTLFDKKPRKPGGFVDRMVKAMEAKQKQVLEAQQKPKQGGGRGGRRRK